MDKIIEFMKKYEEYYSEYFIGDRLSKCKYGYTCDVNQLYCYFNMIDINKTEYYTFYNISNKMFDFTNKKVLEVACGYIPILSSIYMENNIDTTAINNKILVHNYKNVRTIEYDLNSNYDLTNYDIIIGLRSCSITENVMDMCYNYKKDFIFYLCPCIHIPDNKNQNATYDDWINYLKCKLDKFNNYSINFTKSEDLPDNCPIIVGKYLKKKIKK